jgi:hypothetical protein
MSGLGMRVAAALAERRDSRRLVIRHGVEPDRMHGHVPVNPARGKAQGRIGPPAERACRGSGPQTGAKPRSRSQFNRRSTAFLIH